MNTTTPSFVHPLVHGFLLCIGMIIAVGPQNLFLLRQGLRRQHLLTVALCSTLADLVLIALGVGGLSAVIASHPVIQTVTTIGGVLFMLMYGGRALFKACRPGAQASCAAPRPVHQGLRTIVVTTLCFSLLNPSTYLETLLIIGTKSHGFPPAQRVVFGIGAVLASALWFFTLTYGASKLAPLLRSRAAWRTLDIVSGCIMLGIAGTVLSTLC